MLQDFVAILVVLVAVAFLARRGWQIVARGRGGCSSCRGCVANSHGTLVSITPIVQGAQKRPQH